jgi:hypothetical protein
MLRISLSCGCGPAVLHVETRETERLYARRDAARDRLGRADVERALIGLLIEWGSGRRRPAAKLPDRGRRFARRSFAWNPNGVVVYPPYLMGQYCGYAVALRLRGYPMTLKGVPAVTIVAIVWFGVQAKAQTPCPELVRLRNAATEAWKDAMRVPRSERCGALSRASSAAEATLEYANNNRESCDISVPLLNHVEGDHRKVVQARDNVCAGRPLRPYPPDIIQR